jgi:outer membrane protein OmpA-like peptidoglycan-associated protein
MTTPAKPNYWQSFAEFGLVLVFVFILATMGILVFTIKMFTTLMPPEIVQAQEKLKKDVNPMVATVCAPEGYNQLIVLSGDEFFEFNKFEAKDLKPQGRDTIEQIAEVLKGQAASLQRIQIEGHASWEPPGTNRAEPDEQKFAAYNIKLSAERAQTVFSLLVEKKVPPEKMSVAGLGFYKPLPEGNDRCATGTSAELEPWKQRNRDAKQQGLNRRINLFVIYSPLAPPAAPNGSKADVGGRVNIN